MSYEVLARKWRPRNFDELVGQEHVQRALVNALDQERLHHAYLFTGTRGVGKTTIARILAKSLNCEAGGVTSSPCGSCDTCKEIDAGRYIDLIEVDAASRTRVDETRELLDNVPYSPTRGRYKVYLIDEVHMFSTHSFNALLKTLEEPPPHVKFLLATTDPQKVPVTILSRCLQFNLKLMPVPVICEHLERITAAEGIHAEPAALMQIARSAAGSMRDALSLLDQAVAYGQGDVGTESVEHMLGTLSRDRLFTLLEAVAAGDAATLLDEVAGLARTAADLEPVLADLLALLHEIAVAQAVPDALDETLPDRQQILDLAARLPAEDIQLYYQIAAMGRRDLAFAPDPRSGLEMTLLRMLAFRPAQPGSPEPSGPPSRTSSAPPPKPETPAATPTPAASAPAPAEPGLSRPAPAAGQLEAQSWSRVVAELQIRGLAGELAANSVLLEHVDGKVRLALAPEHGHLGTDKYRERLAESLAAYLGHTVRVELEHERDESGETPAEQEQRLADERQQSAVEEIESDPTVQALQERFGAKVEPDTVQPLDNPQQSGK